MKHHPIMVASLIALAIVTPTGAIAYADESGTQERVDTTQYLIELSEYELSEVIPIGLGEPEVIDAICDSDAKPVETIRLTAIAEMQSMVKFGKNVTVTTGSTTQGRATSRQTKQIEIGTILHLQIKPHAKGAIASIDYTTSRMDGDGTDHSPPDILSNTFQSSQIYTLGKPRLLSTVGAKKLTAVIVTVREID